MLEMMCYTIYREYLFAGFSTSAELNMIFFIGTPGDIFPKFNWNYDQIQMIFKQEKIIQFDYYMNNKRIVRLTKHLV